MRRGHLPTRPHFGSSSWNPRAEPRSRRRGVPASEHRTQAPLCRAAMGIQTRTQPPRRDHGCQRTASVPGSPTLWASTRAAPHNEGGLPAGAHRRRAYRRAESHERWEGGLAEVRSWFRGSGGVTALPGERMAGHSATGRIRQLGPVRGPSATAFGRFRSFSPACEGSIRPRADRRTTRAWAKCPRGGLVAPPPGEPCDPPGGRRAIDPRSRPCRTCRD